MNETAEKSRPDSLNSNSGERGAAANASATLHDRTGLLVAIIALSLATLALGAVVGFMCYTSTLKDDIIRLEGQNEDLRIRLDELKK